MRQKIDAHVHIVPTHLLGKYDQRFGVTVEPYGVKRFNDGSIYQFMPDYMPDSSFAADTLIKSMDNHGIERAVILQSPCFNLNDDVIQAVHNHPDRFKGSMIIEPSDETCIEEIEYFRKQGLTVMKFEMSAGLGYTHPNMYPDMKFDSQLFEKIWAKAEELRITVTIDPGPVGGTGYQVERLDRMIRRFSALRFVFCHLGFPFHDMHNNAERYQRWRDMTALADYPNVWFDVSALPALFAEEGYPFGAAMRILHEFIAARGNDKPIWGSDVPGTLCYGTYGQLAAAFEGSLEFTEEQKDRMFSLNAQQAYF
jgi:predicted TIM-barrel fold metal-dependent hydrolase